MSKQIEVYHYKDCDRCGHPVTDEDETLCQDCQWFRSQRLTEKKRIAQQRDLFGYAKALENAIPDKKRNNKDMPIEEQIRSAELSHMMDKYQIKIEEK
jgi:ribosomal protein L37E